MCKWLLAVPLIAIFLFGLAEAGGFKGHVYDRFDNPAPFAYVEAVATDSTGDSSGVHIDDYADSSAYYELTSEDGLFSGYWKLRGKKSGWVSQWYGPHYWNGHGWITVDMKLDQLENIPKD